MVIRIRWKSVVLFLVLAVCTAAAISASLRDGREPEAVQTTVDVPAAKPCEPSTRDETPTEALQTAFQPRLRAPELTDDCYYSSENIFYEAGYGMPNCTCYAWGRAYELTGKKPELSTSDAGTWFDYNKENGIYDYGEIPRRGAIACWSYADGGPGHVAVVEEIAGDKMVCSNSAYSGTSFYLDTLPVDNPCEGRPNWIFQGYIYVDGAARV